MSNEKALVEARELSELLIGSSDLARETFADIANELQIPVSITRALCALEAPTTMTDLAAKLRCDKSYVTTLADQLEGMQLLIRVPGPDRRTKLLELTASGTALRDKLEARVAELSPAMTSLSATERATLRALLEKISPAN